MVVCFTSYIYTFILVKVYIYKGDLSCDTSLLLANELDFDITKRKISKKCK